MMMSTTDDTNDKNNLNESFQWKNPTKIQYQTLILDTWMYEFTIKILWIYLVSFWSNFCRIDNKQHINSFCQPLVFPQSRFSVKPRYEQKKEKSFPIFIQICLLDRSHLFPAISKQRYINHGPDDHQRQRHLLTAPPHYQSPNWLLRNAYIMREVEWMKKGFIFVKINDSPRHRWRATWAWQVAWTGPTCSLLAPGRPLGTLTFRRLWRDRVPEALLQKIWINRDD